MAEAGVAPQSAEPASANRAPPAARATTVPTVDPQPAYIRRLLAVQRQLGNRMTTAMLARPPLPVPAPAPSGPPVIRRMRVAEVKEAFEGTMAENLGEVTREVYDAVAQTFTKWEDADDGEDKTLKRRNAENALANAVQRDEWLGQTLPNPADVKFWVGIANGIVASLDQKAKAQRIGKEGADDGTKLQPVTDGYFVDWPPTTNDLGARNQFVTFVRHAVTAGMSSGVVLRAAEAVLLAWEGWPSSRGADFPFAYVSSPNGLQTKLADIFRGSAHPQEVDALLRAVFDPRSSDTQLEALGRAAGFEPGGPDDSEKKLQLDPRFETEMLNDFAERFERRGDWKGQGPIFKLAWERAADDEKHRILQILKGPDWQDGTEAAPAHLSDLGYLVEGVTGMTPRSPAQDIKSWGKAPKGSLFAYMARQAGYKTKYMTAEEREKYKLTITSAAVTTATAAPLVGDNIFVLSSSGAFYGGTKASGLSKSNANSEALHHSSFMAGAPVRGAGHLITDGSGRLTLINDQSGHYAPTGYEMGLVLYELERCGVDLRKVWYKTEGVSAAEVLQTWKTTYLPKESGPEKY